MFIYLFYLFTELATRAELESPDGKYEYVSHLPPPELCAAPAAAVSPFSLSATRASSYSVGRSLLGVQMDHALSVMGCMNSFPRVACCVCVACCVVTATTVWWTASIAWSTSLTTWSRRTGAGAIRSYVRHLTPCLSPLCTRIRSREPVNEYVSALVCLITTRGMHGLPAGLFHNVARLVRCHPSVGGARDASQGIHCILC
jgi:putative component of membrane protein insertase Oxa1/YidC/SpoIIIJ protein YidD